MMGWHTREYSPACTPTRRPVGKCRIRRYRGVRRTAGTLLDARAGKTGVSAILDAAALRRMNADPKRPRYRTRRTSLPQTVHVHDHRPARLRRQARTLPRPEARILVAKPNYSFEKRQRELAQKKKQDEKDAKKRAERAARTAAPEQA